MYNYIMKSAQITIYKINDKNLPSGFLDGDSKIILGTLLEAKNKTWKAVDYEQCLDETERIKREKEVFLDDKKERKGVLIGEELFGQNFEFIFFKKTIRAKEEEIAIFNNLGIDIKDYSREYKQPSLLMMKKYKNQYFLLAMGDLNKTIKLEYIDTDFAIKTAFKLMEQEHFTIDADKTETIFKSIATFNYLNSIKSVDSTEQRKEEIEQLNSGLWNIRKMIISGSVRFSGEKDKNKKRGDTKFSFLLKSLLIRYKDGISMTLSEEELKNVGKTIEIMADLYRGYNGNKKYGFVDYFTSVIDDNVEKMLYKEILSKNDDWTKIIMPEKIQEKVDMEEENFDEIILKLGGKYIQKFSVKNPEEIYDKQTEIFNSIIEKLDKDDNWSMIKKIKIVFVVNGKHEINHFFIELLESYVIPHQTNTSYFLLNKKWYKINRELEERISEEYMKTLLIIKKENIKFICRPDKKELKYESIYNWFLTKEKNGAILLDGFNITYKKTSFELADVIKYNSEKHELEMYFVKIGADHSSIAVLLGQTSNTLKIIQNNHADLRDIINLYINKYKQAVSSTRKQRHLTNENYYFSGDKNKKEIIKKLEEILNSPLETIKINAKIIFVKNNNNKNLSPMAMNQILQFNNDISQFANEKTNIEIIEAHWNTSHHKNEAVLVKGNDHIIDFLKYE